MKKHFYSRCPRTYYRIEAAQCADAVTVFLEARQKAMDAKREIWKEKYNAEGGVTGGSIASRGLLYADTAAGREAMYALASKGGFKQPKRIKDGDATWWQLSPNRSTALGKTVHADLEHVDKLLDEWQWSLERALGINGAYYYDRAFHNNIAHALSDGSVAISIVTAPKYREPTAIPPHAQPISEIEYSKMRATATYYEESMP